MKTKVKNKKCKWCGKEFTPFKTTQKVCGVPCAIGLANKERIRKEKKELNERKKKFYEKDKTHWTKKAQSVFNTFIRLRDINDPCISCGKYHRGQYHAGHYKTIGAHGSLRFHTDNCHKQCSACNNNLSGNIIEYRKNLINKIGQENVEFLESHYSAKTWSIEELKEIHNLYKSKAKEMEIKNNEA